MFVITENIMKRPVYYTDHPDETAHGGTAVIIGQNIKHYIRAEYRHENIQAARIAIEDNTGETTVSAIYCPPKHHNKYDDYDRFFNTRKPLHCRRRL
jgi:hypothetical protein